MKQRWTLNVEGFGKIEKASIRVSPFMVFVGENNSGKSYLMSLLWGIMGMQLGVFPREIPTSATYRACRDWLKQQHGVEKVTLDKTTQNLFIDWFNDVLENGKEELCRNIFNHPVKIDRLYISDYFVDRPITQQFHDLEQEIRNFTEEELYVLLRLICFNLLMIDLCSPVSEATPIYLPASRTGFMLTYKMLAKQSVRFGFGSPRDNGQHVKLTLPVTKFLSELVGLEFDEGSRYCSVINFLEQEILQGEIHKDDAPTPNYLFKPSDLDEQLSLHLTSSLVSEIAPIILFLKSNLAYNMMVIEEPEAHLHLEMQKKMAQAIVRLVNLGLPVWITTHSDTMFQQFNNLIKLYNHPSRDELAQKHGYEADDFLDPSEVSAYQFKAKSKGKTSVEALKVTDYGIIAPTFNQSIINLRNETIEFQEFDRDAE